MSITDKNSVLILGAGVSVLFGMPLGGELIEKIRVQIEDECKFLKGVAARNFHRNYGDFLRDAVDRNAEIHSAPIHVALYYKYSDGRINEEFLRHKKNLEEMLPLLSDQTSETIDDFIVENR